MLKNNIKSFSKRGELNPMWKGALPILKTTLHEYVINHIGTPKVCVDCGSTENIDLANKSGKYLRDFFDWDWLCRHCHMIKDGRLNNLHDRERYPHHNFNLKFSDEVINEVRSLKGKMTLREIGKRFNMNFSYVGQILRGASRSNKRNEN